MSKKLPVNGFVWIDHLPEFNEDFIKKYDENGDIGYIPELDTDYPKELFKLHSVLPFLPKRKKKW